MDIGGGSTECILGERFESGAVHSLNVGCVNVSRRFFPDGQITEAALAEARVAVALEVRSIERSFRDAGWTRAVGSSGTVRATQAVLRAQGWVKGEITAGGLKKLAAAMVAAGDVRALDLKGLKAERAPVFPGGVAILFALFDRLKIRSLGVSSGAMREGVLYDLLGRIRHEDVRERTIGNFQDRYRVDRAQAARVERVALALLAHAPKSWKMDPTKTAACWPGRRGCTRSA